jgi:hypothetical protein
MWTWSDFRYGQKLLAQPSVRCPVFKRSRFRLNFESFPHLSHILRMLSACCRRTQGMKLLIMQFVASSHFEHTVVVRERPSFIHQTIYGQNCHGNFVMCSPCQISLSLLQQICALFIYGLLCDATRLQRHLTGQVARLLQTSVFFLDICIISVLHCL